MVGWLVDAGVTRCGGDFPEDAKEGEAAAAGAWEEAGDAKRGLDEAGDATGGDE